MIRIGRRGWIAAFGASMAVLGLRPTSAAPRASSALGSVVQRRWLLDASIPSEDVAGFDVAAPVMLGADLVQQWRNGLRDELRSDSRPSVALVRWDKSFVLQGLAREEGMQVAVERLSPSLFRVAMSVRD